MKKKPLIDVLVFAKLNKLARLNLIKEYSKKGIRFNSKVSMIEIYVRTANRKDAVWIPLDYCMDGSFSKIEMETAYDEIAN